MFPFERGNTSHVRSSLGGDIQVLASTGDFLVTKSSGLSLWSTTGVPKTEDPCVSFPHIATVQSQQHTGLVSWLLGAKSGMTGEEFDVLSLCIPIDFHKRS